MRRVLDVDGNTMRHVRSTTMLTAAVLGLTACAGGPSGEGGATASPAPSRASASTVAGRSSTRPFAVTEVATYDEPWAMTFLPGTDTALITQRGGALFLRDMGRGTSTPVSGVPRVLAAGQGGLGDVLPAPSFASDGTVYLSWVEAGAGGSGAVVGRARLVTSGSPALKDVRVIWRQEPKVSGNGHFSHRLALSPDGRYLFVSSGERQKFTPAQDLKVNLGKIVRLNLDGTPAAGNPFADRGGVSAQVWTYGHRNVLGLAFDADGHLWASEMGPKGGDEVNLIERGQNYGWPKASNGSHYNGADIPDHRPGDGFAAPKAWWNPSISPGSLLAYTGTAFPDWTGDLFVGALSGKALIRLERTGTDLRIADRWDLADRIREVEQGPDGTIWLLTDGPDGRLLHLTPS